MTAEIIRLADYRKMRAVRLGRRPTQAADIFLLPVIPIAICMEMTAATLQTAARLATLPLWLGGSDDLGL